ncbi:hypothetical protein CISIN_1g036440mg, partial [Citrus sinensis]
FNQAVASDTQTVTASLALKYCKQIFERLGSLVDVGAFPCVKCTEFDQPHVVANLLDTNNLKYLADDFFQSIPPVCMIPLRLGYSHIKIMIAFFIRLVVGRGRLHIFSWLNFMKRVINMQIIIHVFGDEESVKILKICREAITSKAKLSTEKELESLFVEVHFHHYKITPLFGLPSLIEVYP